MKMNSKDYYYDEINDILNIYLSKSDNIYSEEIEDNIYIVKDRENDDIIGVEILYYSLQNKVWLESVLPISIDLPKIESSKNYKLSAIG